MKRKPLRGTLTIVVEEITIENRVLDGRHQQAIDDAIPTTSQTAEPRGDVCVPNYLDLMIIAQIWR
jgi:hypothetical protein